MNSMTPWVALPRPGALDAFLRRRLLAQLAPYLPYLIGFAVKAVLDYLGVKLPMVPAPAPGPDGQPAADDDALIVRLLKLFTKARSAPQAMTEKEKAVAGLAWDITPDKRPE